MAETADLAAEMLRRAEAEVDRAVGEFERGEDVHYPSFDCIDGITADWEPNADMPVLYPAGRPVVATLNSHVAEDPCCGRNVLWETKTLLPRRLVKPDVARLRAAARRGAERAIAAVRRKNGAIDPARALRCLYFAVWFGGLRDEFSRQFSECARTCPEDLETFERFADLHPRGRSGKRS